MPKPPPPVQTTAPKVSTHTHTCSRHLHAFTCQFSNKCHLEMIPGAQAIIDEMCQFCHALARGSYGT